MNILITGGAGFIGSHLVDFHLNQGDHVVVVDNLSTGSAANLDHVAAHPHFHFYQSDLLDWVELPEFVVWAHRIYHLASWVGMYALLAHPVDTLTSNVLSCERLLRTIYETRSSATLMLASTSELYAASSHEYLKEDEILAFKAEARGKWVYATSKFTEEMLTLAYVRTKALRAIIIRLFNTIGPRQNSHYGMVVPRFIEQAMQNQPMTIYGTGEQIRSYCDVRDTVAAMNAIANQSSATGEIINLGQDQALSVNQLAFLIKKLAQSKSNMVYLSYEEAYQEPYEDVLHRKPDLTKFYYYSNYIFQWHLEQTLLTLMDDYKKGRQ